MGTRVMKMIVIVLMVLAVLEIIFPEILNKPIKKMWDKQKKSPEAQMMWQSDYYLQY